MNGEKYDNCCHSTTENKNLDVLTNSKPTFFPRL